MINSYNELMKFEYYQDKFTAFRICFIFFFLGLSAAVFDFALFAFIFFIASMLALLNLKKRIINLQADLIEFPVNGFFLPNLRTKVQFQEIHEIQEEDFLGVSMLKIKTDKEYQINSSMLLTEDYQILKENLKTKTGLNIIKKIKVDSRRKNLLIFMVGQFFVTAVCLYSSGKLEQNLYLFILSASLAVAINYFLIIYCAPKIVRQRTK